MKIFVHIPDLPGGDRMSAVTALQNLSYPSFPIRLAKKITETPGWHHIYNEQVKGLDPYTYLLKEKLAELQVDFWGCIDALCVYGAELLLYSNDAQPEDYVKVDYLDLFYMDAELPNLKPETVGIERMSKALVVHELKHALMMATEYREYRMAKYLIDKIAQYDKE